MTFGPKTGRFRCKKHEIATKPLKTALILQSLALRASNASFGSTEARLPVSNTEVQGSCGDNGRLQMISLLKLKDRWVCYARSLGLAKHDIGHEMYKRYDYHISCMMSSMIQYIQYTV